MSRISSYQRTARALTHVHGGPRRDIAQHAHRRIGKRIAPLQPREPFSIGKRVVHSHRIAEIDLRTIQIGRTIFQFHRRAEFYF